MVYVHDTTYIMYVNLQTQVNFEIWFQTGHKPGLLPCVLPIYPPQPSPYTDFFALHITPPCSERLMLPRMGLKSH